MKSKIEKLGKGKSRFYRVNTFGPADWHDPSLLYVQVVFARMPGDPDDMDAVITERSVKKAFNELAKGFPVKFVGWEYPYEQYHDRDNWRHADEYPSDGPPIDVTFKVDIKSVKVTKHDIDKEYGNYLAGY